MGASQGKLFKVGGRKYRAIRVIEDQCNGFKIYHVQDRLSSEVLALKRTKAANKSDCPALRELTILKQLPPHPHVLQYRDHKMKDTGPSRIDIAVLFELSLGTLEKAISPRTTPPSLNAALSCFLMITKGINHIHHHGVVHFNLQPSTVHRTNSTQPPTLNPNSSKTSRSSDIEEKESLVEIENWVWKIGDFGFAIVPSHTWANKQDPRSSLHPFSAPESRNSGSFNSSADVFSLGALLYYLLYMKAPFSLEKLEIATQPANRVKALEPPTLEIPDNLPEQVKVVLESMLQWDPQERLSTDEVLRSLTDYLQNVTGCQCDQPASPSASSRRPKVPVKTVDRIHKKRKLSNPDRPFGNQEAQEIADAVQKAFRCTERHKYIPPKRKHITRLVIKLWQHSDYEGVSNADGPSCRIWTSITRAEVFKEPLVAFKSVTLIQRLMVQGTKAFLMYSAGEAMTVLKQYEDTWKRRRDLAREEKAHKGFLHLLEVIVPYIDYLTTKARFHTDWSEFEGNLAMTSWINYLYIGEWNKLLLYKWGERSVNSITAMLDLATRLVNCGNVIILQSDSQLSSSKVSSASPSKSKADNNHDLALLILSPLLPIMMELDAIYHTSSFVLGIIVFLFGQEKCSDLSKNYCEVISSYIQLGKTIRDSKFENVITRSIMPYPEAPPKVSSLFASEVLPPTSSYPIETDMTERELILSFRSRFTVRQPHSPPCKNSKPAKRPSHTKNQFSHTIVQPPKQTHKAINAYMPHGGRLEPRLSSPKLETHLLLNFPAENDLTPNLCQLDNISPEDPSDESMRLSDSLVAAATVHGNNGHLRPSKKEKMAGRTYSAPNVFAETDKVHVAVRKKKATRRLKVLSASRSKKNTEPEDTDPDGQEDVHYNENSIKIRGWKSGDEGRSSGESKDGGGYHPLVRSSSEDGSPRATQSKKACYPGNGSPRSTLVKKGFPKAEPKLHAKTGPNSPADGRGRVASARDHQFQHWGFRGTGNPFQEERNSAPPHSPAGNNPFKKTPFSPRRHLLEPKGSSDEGEDPWFSAPTEDDLPNNHNNPFLMDDSSPSNTSPSGGNLEDEPSDSKGDEEKIEEDGICWDELKMGERIGIGGSGEVFIAEYSPQNGKKMKVAVKRLLPRKYNKETLLEFRKEIQIFKRLNSYKHPNILAFYGAISTPPNLGLVTELLEMSLFDLLHNTNIRLTWALKEKIAIGSSDGLRFLHEHSIIHRDLKSANLLLNKNFEVKIMDFGLARIKADHDTMTGQTGTYQWMSPEVIKGQKYTESADIYSMGIIFWEICMEKIPFEGMNGIQASVAVVTRKLRPPLWTKDKKPLIGKVNWTRLIQHCWHQNARKRPNINQVCIWLSQMTEKSSSPH